MAILNDIRPLLYGARMFGFTPHRITDHDMIISKIGLFYSIFTALIMCSLCFGRLYLTFYYVIDVKMQILMVGRIILTYVSVLTDSAITILWNTRFANIIMNFYRYDIVSNFTIERINYKLINICRVTIVIVIIFWSLAGIITYLCEKQSLLFNSITYATINAAMSMQILKFIGFVMLIYQRLTHLDHWIQQKGVTISIIHRVNKSTRQRDITWLHHKLIIAAEEINSIYSIQLLLWITLMFLNGLSRIYTLTTSEPRNVYLTIRDTFAVIACAFNLFIISLSCHFTALKANSIGTSIYSPRLLSHRIQALVEDDIEVAMYFHLQKLSFSAVGGFIQIDLPLLLSIAGATTTYLVILHAVHG